MTSTLTPAELKLARQANVKWRTWERASLRAHAPYASHESLLKSIAALNAFTAWLRENPEVQDHANGETFEVNGRVFRYTMKGDPR